MLNLTGLSSVTQLSKGDKVLVVTSNGLEELDAEVLGKVLSNTSLFETYKRVELSELNVSTLTTHNKIQKYLDSDLSDEIYMEYADGVVTFIRAQVLTNSDKIPFTTQAQAITGELLYWSHDLSEAEYYKDFPWKTKDDEKIFITIEDTGHPVTVYQYNSTILKRSEILVENNEPVVVDTYFSRTNSKGIVKKQDNEFLFVLQENGSDLCGIKMSLNEDNTVTGKLIGTWEGLNDWDVDQALTTNKFKEWFYHSQDYYTYVKTLSLETSNKIGWYLNKETENLHVYFRLEGSELVVILAKNKTNNAGSYIQEQAVNLLGENLYWKQEMDYQVGTSANGVPLKSGKYVFMTTEKTEYPVYIYQYDETELFRIDYNKISDNSYSVRQVFSDNGNINAILSKTNTEMVIELVNKTNNTVLSKLVLDSQGGKLTGKWWVEDKELGLDELPEQTEATKNKVLKSNGESCSWENETQELPAQSSATKDKVLKSNGNKCSWEDETTELPEQSSDTKGKILKSDGQTCSWQDEVTELPEQTEAVKSFLLTTDGTSVSWISFDSYMSTYTQTLKNLQDKISELEQKLNGNTDTTEPDTGEETEPGTDTESGENTET